MSSTFKPLLASKVDLDKVRYPVLVSPKLDGIRAVSLAGGIFSRQLKPIPNRHVQQWALDCLPVGLDGEIMTYEDQTPDKFEVVQSKVMSHAGEPDFRFCVFDCFLEPDAPFDERLEKARTLSRLDDRIVPVVHTTADDHVSLGIYEENYVRLGYEGLMLRDPKGRYKYGRSSVNEGILLKMKRFDDAEGVVININELLVNENEAEKDELGHTKRSSKAEGKRPGNTMGSMSLRWGDVEFEVGTGFDAATREAIWRDRDSFIGKKVTFKYQGTGANGRPRFPVFLGFRRDL